MRRGLYYGVQSELGSGEPSESELGGVQPVGRVSAGKQYLLSDWELNENFTSIRKKKYKLICIQNFKTLIQFFTELQTNLNKTFSAHFMPNRSQNMVTQDALLIDEVAVPGSA